MEEFVAASKTVLSYFFSVEQTVCEEVPLTHLKGQSKGSRICDQETPQARPQYMQRENFGPWVEEVTTLRMFVMHGLPSSKSSRESQIPETENDSSELGMGDKGPSLSLSPDPATKSRKRSHFLASGCLDATVDCRTRCHETLRQLQD